MTDSAMVTALYLTFPPLNSTQGVSLSACLATKSYKGIRYTRIKIINFEKNIKFVLSFRIEIIINNII